MFYFSSVFKGVLAIYMLAEVSRVCARDKAHTTKYKIDEFIDKLLASKKFDILAEKFAQKAVERMINLEPKLRFTKDFSAQINSPQQVASKNISYKTDVHLEDSSSPLKNLSLKYKYFTKAAFYDINSEENKKIEIKDIEGSNMTDPKDMEIETGNDDDNESINISDLESSLQDKPMNRSDSLKHNGQGDDEETTNQNKTTKNAEQNDGSISMENKWNAGSLSANSLSDGHKTNESHGETGVVSDFDTYVKKDRTLFSNGSLDAISNGEVKKPRIKRTHREGSRLYTFQSSSDYEEYHQELERVEKDRKVFV